MKWIKQAIFILFAGFLLFGALLQLDSVRSRMKTFLIESIESGTGYTVQIGQIRLFPSFQMTAKDIVFMDGEVPLAAFNHLHLGIYPLDLLKGKLRFSTLHIEGVDVLNLPKETLKSEGKNSTISMIAIEDFFIEKIHWSIKGINPPDYPISLKGSLIVDQQHDLIYSNFNVFSPQSSGVSGDLRYEKKNGTLLLQQEDGFRASLTFVMDESRGVRVPRFLATWHETTIDGKFSVTQTGGIEDSAFFLSIDDLSQMVPISGALLGEAVISGSINSPKIDLSLSSNQLSGFGQTVEKLKLHLSTSGKGSFSLAFVKNEQDYMFSSALTWDQKTPWFPTQLDLRLPLEKVAQLANWDVADIDGQLLINVRYQNQTLTFKAELLEALVESFSMGSRFINIHGIIEGDLKTLKLVHFTAKDTDNGSYSGNGRIELDQKKNFPFNFVFQLEEAKPFQSDIFKSATSGELTFKGNLSKAILKGDLSGSEARVQIPEKMPESSDSIKVTYINQPEDEPPPTKASIFSLDWPVELDVNYTIADQLTIKGGNLSSTWIGKVNIGGTLDKLKTKGEVKLDKGRFILRGKTFEFVQGAITFNGDPEKNTNLYLSAEMDLIDLTIQVVLNGPILNPSITLTSSPPMSQRAILSWLLFGKGISDINPMEETQLSRSLRSLLDKVGDKPDVLTRMGGVLGLDQVEIGANPGGETGDLTVKVGKYLSEGTYLSISRNISRGKDPDKNTSCFGIETKLGRHFRFRAEGDTETNGRLNLLWKNDY